MTSGNIVLNGISDKQVAKTFEFKVGHEKDFNITFAVQPQGNQPASYNGLNISWQNDGGLKAVLELVQLLLA